MAKKKIAGTGGNVSFVSGFNGHFRNFTYNMALPEAETTGFGDGGFFTGEPVGGIRVTGDVSGVLEYDDTNAQPFPDAFGDGGGLAVGDLAGLQGAMTLTFITGCTLAFTANVTGINGNRGETTLAENTWTYGSTGALTIVWDETA